MATDTASWGTGWSARRIARELGLNRRTVGRALALEGPPEYRRTVGASPLEPWKTTLEAGVRRGLRGSRVLRDLRQSAAAEAVAQSALADAVDYNLYSPRFVAERLRRRGLVSSPGLPTPPPLPGGQLALPRLEVERSLLGYGGALTEPERDRLRRENAA